MPSATSVEGVVQSSTDNEEDLEEGIVEDIEEGVGEDVEEDAGEDAEGGAEEDAGSPCIVTKNNVDFRTLASQTWKQTWEQTWKGAR